MSAVSGAGNQESFLSQLQAIPKKIQAMPKKVETFFYHRYVDGRLFSRAFSSINRYTTVDDIASRIDQLTNLRNAIVEVHNQSAATQVNQIRREFDRLSQPTIDLLYLTDFRHVGTYLEQPPEKRENLLDGMARECKQAMAFQGVIFLVSQVFHKAVDKIKNILFGSPVQTPVSVSSPPDQTPQNNPDLAGIRAFGAADYMTGVLRNLHPNREDFEQFPQMPERPEIRGVRFNFPDQDTLLGQNRIRPDPSRRVRNSPSQPLRPSQPLPAGTIAYVRGSIPREVVTKGNEIERLRDLYDALPPSRPDVPDHMKCPIALDTMSIPVFDSRSHNSANRAHRHALDQSSIEGVLGNRNRGSCPGCRQPLKRDDLVIDTALQEEILQFLKTATGN